MTRQRVSFGRCIAAAAFLALLGACGGGDDAPAAASPTAGDIASSTSFTAPAAIAADSRLLVHWMKGARGGLVKASATFFVPRGAAPAGGWPLVAWVHATTTVGTGAPIASACAPSNTPLLDGGFNADGFPADYVGHIAALVGAGYAVIAPDLEGQGVQAQADGTPYPYYNIASSGASVAAAVVAAHRTGVTLSNDWAAVGHSEGGHVVMGLESSAKDAASYSYKGTVAFAPFNSIEASVGLIDSFAAADPANAVNWRITQELFVGMFGNALANQQPSFTPNLVMGPDLLALIPSFQGKCIFKTLGDVGGAIVTRTPAAFSGFSATWASNASMKTFLETNDLAVSSSFKVDKPLLVLQGGTDPFVYEQLQTAFVNRMTAAGMPVTYRTFPSADHATIITLGRSDMLTFLKSNLP